MDQTVTCKELRLIIEVDGESHEHENQWYKDQSRQQELEDYGFTVLRFLDEEVFKDLENVSRVIEHWIESHPLRSLRRGTTEKVIALLKIKC